VIVRHVSVGEDVEQHELTIPIVVNRVSADEAAGRRPDLEVQREVLVLTAARARDRAIELADAGQLDEAQHELRGTVLQLRGSGLDAEADALAGDVIALDAYDPRLRKKLRYDSNRRRGKQI
jgi:hypothetical protein